MREVVIAGAARTPIGTFGGTLKNTSARDLGAICIKEAVRRSGVKPEMIDEIIMGNVLQGGLWQNVARQMMLDAGLPKEIPAFTLNKVCGSGLRAVSLAAQIIKAGDGDIIVAGGAENMSMAGYALPSARWGVRMGNDEIIDMMIKDGLQDAFYGYHMGITAENICRQWKLTRQELDEFAAKSQQKAVAALKTGRFDDEIVPVPIKKKKGEQFIFSRDEYPREGVTVKSISRLKPAFKEDGLVTAANSSGLNDSGCAAVVMSKDKADELCIEPLCTIKSYASAGVEPSIMGIGPVPSVKKALSKAGYGIEDIDLIEANEAFAAQSVAVARELNFDESKLNVNGGAIALGHPIGASGCRILISLMYEMKKRDAKTGLATLCIGGGQGTAMVIER